MFSLLLILKEEEKEICFGMLECDANTMKQIIKI